MNKTIMNIIVLSLLTLSLANAVKIEEYDQLINNTHDKYIKELLRCEKEANLIRKEPTICINAANQLITAKRNNEQVHSAYGSINRAISVVFYNTGKIFGDLNKYSDENNYYEKALSFYEYDEALVSLGYNHATGRGVEQNYYKAFKYWKRAVDLTENPRAVNNLQFICKMSENSWFCK